MCIVVVVCLWGLFFAFAFYFYFVWFGFLGFFFFFFLGTVFGLDLNFILRERKNYSWMDRKEGNWDKLGRKI